MPTQKVFKQRVRTRMAKTGESYTAARHQLLRKAGDPSTRALPDPSPQSIPADAMLVADAAMIRATGKGHAEWFALLDGWRATEHTHTEIARWLSHAQDVPGWWTQNVTVAYERARGMRARHQMADGFSVSVTRTVSVPAGVALAAFTDTSVRRRWLLGDPMRQRPTRAALSARFDWADPPSRVVVTIEPKGQSKCLVAVAHERLPDADTGEGVKAAWRDRLDRLRAVLEADRTGE